MAFAGCGDDDDGHGMSARSSFLAGWWWERIQGDGRVNTIEDRNGLHRRRDRVKRDGRLSCANPARCFLVSKRKREPFIAALIDWRLSRTRSSISPTSRASGELSGKEQLFEQFQR